MYDVSINLRQALVLSSLFSVQCFPLPIMFPFICFCYYIFKIIQPWIPLFGLGII